MRVAGCLLIAPLAWGVEIRLSEIMYNPPEGQHLEFLELAVVVGGDFTRFSVSGGVSYEFPEGAILPSNSFVVLAQDPDALKAHYAQSGNFAAFAYSDRLSNTGEELVLRNPSGEVIERVFYDDNPPWDFLADGYGRSLSRVCMSADPQDPNNWVAYPPSPGLRKEPYKCPPPVREPPPVVLNEVMYHPNGGGDDERLYEFVELHNRTDAEIKLDSWQLAGALDFKFGAGQKIPARGYLVVAANPWLLRDVYPDLPVDVVAGPFGGDLDNGGGKIAILDAVGGGVDAVTYEDDFPWPIATDGYGELRGRGFSLERLCPDLPSGLVSNWLASPVDAATPGKANSQVTCDLPIAATALATAPDPITAADPIKVTVELSGPLPADQLRLVHATYRLPGDPMEPESEPFALAGGRYTATIPAQAEGTVVRWRLEIRKGDAWKLLSPRPGDPLRMPWYGLYIPPPLTSAFRSYHLLIAPDMWAQAQNNARSGRVVGSQVLESWNESVPAIFTYGNHLWDVRARYQGSQWHRADGFNASGSFTCPGPNDGQQPYPVRLVSWRIRFPRYDQFGGRKAIVLHKNHTMNTMGDFYFHGLQASLGYRLLQEAGVPAPNTRFAHVSINGCYYHFMLELERVDEEMLLERYFEAEGDLFEASGCPRGVSWGGCDSGPFDWADGRPLAARDGWSADDLYAYNYDRRTRQFDDHSAIRDLIEELDATARLGDAAALRAKLAERFDVNSVLRHLATSNWGCAWDDIWQNYYLYADGADGRWHMFPWDMDQMFGGPVCCRVNVQFDASVWRGRKGDPYNWEPDTGKPAYNRFKDYFFHSFPEEYFFRLVTLNNEVFIPDELRSAIAKDASALRAEAWRSALPIQARIDLYEQTISEFVRKRHEYINSLVIPAVDAGDDFTVEEGRVYTFDATRSSPPPGPDVAYKWSNGMTGSQPSAVFNDPGTRVLSLTITKKLRLGEETSAVARSDDVIARVLPASDCFYLSEDGMAVFEAEEYHAIQQGVREFAEMSWGQVELGEASGGLAMAASGPTRVRDELYGLHAPELNWVVEVETGGAYALWVRAKGGGHILETRLYVGLAHEAPALSDSVECEGTDFTWQQRYFVVQAAGRVLVSVWLSDPEVVVDKLIVTSNNLLVPEGLGPPATNQDCPTRGFVRGNVNGDDRANLADAVAILCYLFHAEPVVTCEDAGDANDDGSLNIADAVYILMYFFAKGPAPKPPFPDPGLDPTTDDPYTCGDG